MIQFSIDKEKTVEALVYIAHKVGEVGRFHAGKILYYADMEHLRRFGRPITGDTFIAMENGPVPSFAYDVLKGTTAPADRSVAENALEEVRTSRHPVYRAKRSPNPAFFSKTDIACLNRAISHCMALSFGQLSDETHKHKAWQEADLNARMSFETMLDGADQNVVEEAQAFAAYGVL
jgi:uncharacterized phage-associated protein